MNSKIKRPVILGQFGPPTLAIIRSWGMHHKTPGFICIQGEEVLPPKSKYLKGFKWLPKDWIRTDKGIDHINQFLETFDADGLTCVAETVSAWIYENRNKLYHKTRILLPESRTLLNNVDKKYQIEKATLCGFNVLPTYYLDLETYKTKEIDPRHFPLCLRPSTPFTITPGFKVKLINNVEELFKYLSRLKKFNGTIVAQPFLNLPNLNIHAQRDVNGVLYNPQAFLVKRKFEGVSLVIQPTRVPNHLFKLVSRFADSINVMGLFDFEMLYDPEKEKYYFIESNCRFGGTTAKILALGYHEPAFTLSAYEALPLGHFSAITPPKIKFSTSQLSGSTASRHALFRYFFIALKNKITPFDYPEERRSRRIFSILKILFDSKDDIFHISDIKGSLSLYANNFLMSLKGLRRTTPK